MVLRYLDRFQDEQLQSLVDKNAIHIIIETISGALDIICDMTVGGMVMLPKRLKQ